MKRIGILVVAYNAATTLARVLDRIPRDFLPSITEVLVCDDASQDSTYLVGLGYQQTVTDLPLTVIRHPENLGYGGNQKSGYRWAIEHGLDIVVLLHGDGQYAPEFLPQIVAPLMRDECDAVFGSRMIEKGAAREGGMPLYKYLGNRALTTWENALVGTSLSEWHSGYRAYSVRALEEIPFEKNSDGFDFDTEIIIQLHEAGKQIVELPIPTYYGDEICYVNGLKYAKDITRTTARYRLHKMGFGSGDLAFASQAYEYKDDPASSHGRLLSWLQARRPGRVLDLGCSDGALSERVRAMGHEVTGVDVVKHEQIGDRVDRFVEADLDRGIPAEIGDGYDVVLMADVLEHVRQPDRLLAEATRVLAPGGSILLSVPNFGHWYPRTRTALGLFDYDRRGILDDGHVRFFTRRSIERRIAAADLAIVRREATGLPVDVADRGGEPGQVSTKAGLVRKLDRLAVQVRPQLFGYQLVYELRPRA
jgi:glycosyltransferase involved in cell wall biosynthesis